MQASSQTQRQIRTTSDGPVRSVRRGRACPGLVLVPGMEVELLLDGQASDEPPAQLARGEGLRQVVKVRPVRAGLATGTAVVEMDRVHVNPSIPGRS
jgi:hypothetical protein